MTQAGGLSDRQFKRLQSECETLTKAVAQASKTTGSSFTALLVILAAFALVTFGNFVTDDVSIPLLTLKLNRWHAAALGPVAVACAAFNFGCARLLLHMRIRLLMPRLRELRRDSDTTLPADISTPESFVGAVLHPSAHTVVDYLYVKKRPGFRFVMETVARLWLVVPMATVVLSYQVVQKYHWNVFLIAAYFLTFLATAFSLSNLPIAYKGEASFDFADGSDRP